MVKVEFLFWRECPSHEMCLQRLKRVLDSMKVEYNLKIIEVKTEEDAKKFKFPGSPTIRINGIDIQPESSKGPYGLSCRAYIIEGRVLPVPTEKYIEESIRRILKISDIK